MYAAVCTGLPILLSGMPAIITPGPPACAPACPSLRFLGTHWDQGAPAPSEQPYRTGMEHPTNHHPYIPSTCSSAFQAKSQPSPFIFLSPQGLGSRNGVFLLDGPDAEIEFWDDMRSGQPDPMLIGKEQTQVWYGPVGRQGCMQTCLLLPHFLCFLLIWATLLLSHIAKQLDFPLILPL